MEVFIVVVKMNYFSNASDFKLNFASARLEFEYLMK